MPNSIAESADQIVAEHRKPGSRSAPAVASGRRSLGSESGNSFIRIAIRAIHPGHPSQQTMPTLHKIVAHHSSVTPTRSSQLNAGSSNCATRNRSISPADRCASTQYEVHGTDISRGCLPSAIARDDDHSMTEQTGSLILRRDHRPRVSSPAVRALERRPRRSRSEVDAPLAATHFATD